MVLALSACLVASQACADRTIVLALSENVLPVEKSAEILKAAYAALDIRVELVRAPRSRTLVLSSTGQVDGEVVAGRAIEAKYPSLKRVDVPLMTIEMTVFTCSADLSSFRGAALASKRVGRLAGAVVQENITKGFRDVWAGESFEELFDMLKLGRLDAVIGARQVLETYGADNEIGCIRVIEEPILSVRLYHYLHERNAELIPSIRSALMELSSQDGASTGH
ncbi:MAG: transporter substrate-binding domain-containing protein [Roseibium sp.]|uniref:substrate-binding periplasmic protein n=1 Tax=Roseibium sp. TaxID=1936156 RepID=UPI003D9C2D00